MKTIRIAESVLAVTPEIFKGLLDNHIYRLTKTSSSRTNWNVSVNDSVTGDLSIVDVAELGKPGVKVVGQGMTQYIRTSPLVEVIEKVIVREGVIDFRTEGGTYCLEDLGEEK